MTYTSSFEILKTFTEPTIATSLIHAKRTFFTQKVVFNLFIDFIRFVHSSPSCHFQK